MHTGQHGWGRWLAAGVTASALAGTAVAIGATGGAAVPTATVSSAGPTDTVLAGQVAPDGAKAATPASPRAHSASGGCTVTTFTAHQQDLQAALADRATKLAALATRVSAAKHLPASDAATLTTIIQGEQSSIDGGGIAGLQSAVTGETTCAQLATSAKQMVVDFRVYMLVARQVNIAVCSSGSLAAATKATASEAAIDARITKAQQRGKNVSAAEQAFASMQQQLSVASQDLSGIDLASVLAQVPADAPADKAMLSGITTTMEQADTALKAARSDRQSIRQDLKSTASGSGAPAQSTGAPTPVV